MADFDITAPGSSENVNGAIFTDTVNVGSGTGNYETFIALSDNDGTLSGFNSDETAPKDATNQNGDLDLAKSEAILLGSIPITIGTGPVADGGNGLPLGVAFYEFRTDLNEPNNATTGRLSIDAFKIYISQDGTIESKTALEASGPPVYDLGAGNRVLLSEVSTGSGTDDYAVFVPVSNFGTANPSTTYLYLYLEMGFLGGDFADSGGFEEWNTQQAGALVGVKFFDVNGDGVRDLDGLDNILGGAGAADDEVGLGGVEVFADRQVFELDGNQQVLVRDFNGVLDADEQSTTTAADGSYSFYGLTLGTYRIYEEIPAGYVRTTGDFETVTISSQLKNDGGTLEGIFTVDPIGNHIPTFDISGRKLIDTNGDGSIAGDNTAHAGVTIYIDFDNDGVFDAGEKSAITDGSGNWSITGLDSSFTGKLVRENVASTYITTVGGNGIAITGSAGNNQTGINFGNFQLMNISGYKWNDANNSATWNAGEVTLATWTIYLDNDKDPTNGVIATDVTDVNGRYSFENLGTDNPLIKNDSDGILHVYEKVEAGFTQTYGDFFFTIQSGLTITGDLNTTETGNFGNFMPTGYVRTPGFWQNDKNGGQFWDGIALNEKNAGKIGFADGELLYYIGDLDGDGDADAADNAIDTNGDGLFNALDHKGLLIGDYDKDGLNDEGNAVFISYANARTLIGATDSSNGTTKLGRDVVATWLNYLAEASIGAADGPQTPRHFLDDAIDWFQKYAGVDADASYGDTFDRYNIAAKNGMGSAAWNETIDTVDDGHAFHAQPVAHTAKLLHDELDFYNNTGATFDPTDPANALLFQHYSIHI